MQHIITLFALIFITQIGFAQDNVASDNITVTITLSESDAQNAKSLKGLEHGNLAKGLDQYTFLITADKEDFTALKNELTAIFPSCKIEIREEQ